MALQDLNEELHKRDSEKRADVRSHSFDAGIETYKEIEAQAAFQKQTSWSVPEESFMMRNKKAIRRGLILCGIIISMAVIYFVVV